MSGQVAPKRIGRPPRIDREAIAQAVLEIGFDDVTMKRTAQHLGVSVPGLYHYVRGKDDLVRLAAGYSLSRIRLPEHTGQDWETWLRDWAHYIRGSMGSSPELFTHFLEGGLDEDRFATVVGAALDVLVQLGFSPEAAHEAWGLISAVSLGTAAADLRLRATGRHPVDPDGNVDAAFQRRLRLVIEAIRQHLAPA